MRMEKYKEIRLMVNIILKRVRESEIQFKDTMIQVAYALLITVNKLIFINKLSNN